MKIIWSEFAEMQLDDIFQYYVKKANITVAKKLLRELILEPNKLIDAPFIGQEEAILKDRKINYRYLIFKNYKIIYSVDLENNYIKIADVFDTRQNPPKLGRNK
ncbi:type II toxin-antitoxin system RelE/ParE family toxin [Leeuwenhoekiella parthenopeia]|uniref:Type II toxin-antitoxin system RelE/ParE family toxin n=1 Tax=Leeuwenhoekiella parthenopeia TaxID=2890320 RepID=A0ABS8GVZ3_9FLAO|nr:type II toxin-antitoxin system RelE/ParE family toxin [Leeuwenhoekiella parthenopeia]MCC4214190.1 type II toxin-antitoxin system RelE/ParE family toxin [Leeuwenhoekiella parthenopeia]